MSGTVKSIVSAERGWYAYLAGLSDEEVCGDLPPGLWRSQIAVWVNVRNEDDYDEVVGWVTDADCGLVPADEDSNFLGYAFEEEDIEMMVGRAEAWRSKREKR